MKFFTLSSLLLLWVTMLWAVPAQRVRRTVTLEDGTSVVITLRGDEHYSWWQTDKGQVVEPSVYNPGRYVYSQETLDEVTQTAQRRYMAAVKGARRIGSQATAPLPAIGSPKVPVVLVNFTDSVFTVADTDEGIRQYYDLFCNGTRDGNLYRGHGSYGAIRDYFVQQSDSLFLPEFVIIGPVTLDHPESYYGENGSGKDKQKDKKYSQFRNDAIAKATAIYEGDWKDFDNRGKSSDKQVQVDMVFFIFAGYGEANGGDASTIWPKESTSSVTINDILFSTSACCNEKHMAFDREKEMYYNAPDGIGIMCHELSHALGLPDFYDTNYKAFGMDIWSLMDYGCHASGGTCPVAYTAYERDFMGWRKLVPLNEWGFYSIAPIAAGGIGYKIVNDENPNEFYVLENRQRVEWDRALGYYGHGMQVTHVDYQASSWNNNSVNTDVNHQRMTIIAANNLYDGTSNDDVTAERLYETWSGNAYPYKNGTIFNDSLTANSVPAATVYTKSGFMNKDINFIREHDDNTVSFYFGNDYYTSVQDLSFSPKNVDNGIFDLSGRRLLMVPRKGLYLRGGRKWLVR